MDALLRGSGEPDAKIKLLGETGHADDRKVGPCIVGAIQASIFRKPFPTGWNRFGSLRRSAHWEINALILRGRAALPGR